MKRPVESDYTSHVAYTRALEGYCDALEQQYMTNAAGELEPVTVVQTGVGIGRPEQEPVAWMLKTGHGTGFTDKLTEELKALTWKGKPMWKPLYDAPPQRKPLSDEQRDAIARQAAENDWHDYEIIDAVEAAHGIKE